MILKSLLSRKRGTAAAILLLALFAFSSLAGAPVRAALGPDAFEADNQISQARTIQINTLVTDHSLYPAEDVDWYKFTLTTTSDISISMAGYPYNPTMTIYSDPNGYYSVSYGYDGYLQTNGLAAGDYYLKIYGSVTFNYSFSVNATANNYAEDQYEGDDSIDTAGLIQANQKYGALSIYPLGDPDWFKFTTTEQSNIYISIDSSTDNYFDISIYDSPSSYYYLSKNYRSHYLSITDQPAGTYYVKVEGVNKNSYSNCVKEYYITALVRSGAETIAADQYEPDDNISSAPALTVGTLHENHSIYPAYDYDYCKFFLIENSDLTVTITNPGSISYDFYLTSPELEVYLYPDNGYSFTAEGLRPGTYYLRTGSANYGATTSGYGILVESTPSQLAPDVYEADNSRYYPSVITSGIPQTDRTLYPSNDVDWVSFNCAQDSDVTIVANSPEGITFSYYLYKEDGTESSYIYSYSNSYNNNFSLMGLPAGDWLVEIKSYTGSQVCRYELSVTTSPTKFSADAKEPNDLYTSATPLVSGTPIESLSIFPATDVDWFSFTLTEASHISTTISYYGNYGPKTELYMGSPSSGTLLTSTTYNSLDYSDLPAGTYYISVQSTNQLYTNGLYSIALTVVPDSSGDTFEPDNTYDTAKQLTADVSHGPHTIHHTGDYDWFRFTLAQESGITIEATTVNTSSTYSYTIYMNMYLYSNPSSSSYIGYAYSNRITKTPLKPGTYFIKVYRYSGPFEGNYSIKFSASPTGTPNTGDAYEPNDNWYDAKAMTVGTPITGCSLYPTNDLDWFKFTLSENSNLELSSTMVNPNSKTGYFYIYKSDALNSYIDYTYMSGTSASETYYGLEAGEYYIYTKMSSTTYTMESYSISLTKTATGVAADSAEAGSADNIWENATAIAAGQTITDRTLHHGKDVDWYKFTVTSTSDVVLTNSYNEHAVYMYFYRNPNEGYVTYTSGTTLNQWSLEPGTYYVMIKENSYYNICSGYSLNLALTPTSTGDAYENDDLFQTPSIITAGARQTGRSIHNPKDVDWVKFTLHEASDVIVGVTVESGNYPDFYLYSAADPSNYIGYNQYYSSYHYRITKPFLSPGDYYIKVFDSYQAVDNYTLYLQTSRAPSTDLEITSCVLSPTVGVQSGDLITFKVSVRNNGEAFTTNVKMQARIDGNTFYHETRQVPGSDPAVYQYQVPYLSFAGFAAGETKTFDLAWFATPRAASYAIMVDSDGAILETSEENNILRGSFPFDLNYSDLTISAVTVTPAPDSGLITHGTVVNFAATVKNWGDAFNSSHWYYLYISYIDPTYNTEYWNYIGQVSSTGYGAGETKTITIPWTAGPGEHKRYKLRADSWNSVYEKDENNNEFIGDLNLSLKKSDLKITGVAVSPTTGISQGTPVNFDITVLNDSDAYVDTYHRYELWINGSEVASTFGYGLEAHASKVIRLTWTAYAGVFSGYTIKADSTNRVPEDNETNNDYTDSAWSLTVAESDLTVASLQYTHTSDWNSVVLRDGDATQFTAVIQNLDPGLISTPFRVALYVDDIQVAYVRLNGLGASASESVIFNWIARGNSKDIKVTVDSLSEVVEKSETNNSLTRTIANSPAPDLVVTSLALSPDTGLKDGSATNIVTTVKNIGDGTTVRPFYVNLKINDNVQASMGVSGGLAAGAETTLARSWEMSSGALTATAIVDSANVVGESNEANNELSINLPAVEMPNFAVESMKWLNTEIYDGCQLTVRAVVKNVGSGDTAKSINMKFSVDGTGRFSWTHSGGIAAGATAEVIGQWTYKTGEKNILLEVNPSQVIRESNYADNNSTLALPDTPKPDLELTLIGWEPRNFNLNDTVTLYAQVKNSGLGKTATPFHISFKADDSTITTYSFTKEMAVGKTEQVSIAWTAKYAKQLTVTVDPYKVVGEAEENRVNNTKTEAFPEIPLPDLVFTSLTYSPTTGISQGDPVTVRAGVKNQGMANSAELVASLLVDGKSVDSKSVRGGLWTGMDLEMVFTWNATPGTTRTFKVELDPYKRVPEGEQGELNNTQETVFALDIPGADLILETFTMDKGGSVVTSSDMVRVGDVLTFGVNVRNGGTGPYTKPIPVGFFVDNVLHEVIEISDGLALNASTRVTSNWTYPAKGGRRVNVLVDPFYTITEINETNNVQSAYLPSIPFPDLTVTAIATDFDSSKTYTEQDLIGITVSVKNQGSEKIDKDVDVQVAVGFFNDTQTIAGGLDINETKTVFVSWPVVPRNTATITARVDPNNVYTESNESNNLSSTSISFLKPVEKPRDITLTLDKADVTVPVGGTCHFMATITSRLDDASYIDINALGLDGLQTTIYPPRIYAVAGERYQVRVDVDIPASVDLNTKSVYDFTIKASALTISAQAASKITLVGAPVPAELRPASGTKIGSTEVLISWNSLISSTSVVYYKADGETAFTRVEGLAGMDHKVTLTNLVRNTTYTYYVESASTGGTYTGLGTDERTFTVDNGIVFDRSSYEFTVEKDYNQLVTLTVKNTDAVSHILQLELENVSEELIVGFLGGGSVDFPIPMNASTSKSVTLALHLQDANQESYEIIAKISATRDGQTLVSKVPIKIKVHIPVVDYTIEELETNPVTLAKKFKVTNKGDIITDFNIVFPEQFKDAVVMSPDVAHYKLRKGEVVTFTAIPVLGHKVFMDTFGSSNTVVSSTGVRSLATNRRVPFSVAGQVKGLSAPRYASQHTQVASRGVRMLVSAGVDTSFDAPNGTTPHGVGLPNMNYEAEAKTWHCTNRPNVEVDIPVPPIDVSDDPLYIDFTPNGGWEQRPHDVNIFINGHLVASWKNQIPTGTKQIDFDPSILNIPKAGVAKNRVDIRTVHMNGGHYVVSSNVKFLMHLNEYSTWVMATNNTEAWSLAEQNLPDNIKKAPDSVSFAPMVTEDKIVEGTPTVLKITPKLANGQAARKIQVVAKVGGQNITFSDQDNDGVYEGLWTPKLTDNDTFVASKEITALAQKCVTMEVQTKYGTTIETVCVEESDLTVAILTPEAGFQADLGQTRRVRAKVTNKDGNGVSDPDVISIAFSNGDTGGSMTALSGGEFYFDWTPTKDNTNNPGPVNITVNASHKEYGTATDSVSGKTSAQMALEIKKLSSKFAGHVFYIDGVDFEVEYTVEVDWKGVKPGSVIFKTNKGSETVKVDSETAPVVKKLNMGKSFGLGGTLMVKAVSADGDSESEWKKAEFTIAGRIPFQDALVMGAKEDSGSFAYNSTTAAAMNFIKPSINTDEIPKWVPVIGNKPFLLDFIPKVGAEFKSDGKGEYSFEWGSDALKKEADINRTTTNAAGEKVTGKFAGAEYTLTPKVKVTGDCVKDTGKWKWGGNVGAEGAAEISKSWPFIFTLGPVPIPMYAKVSIKISMAGAVGIQDFSAGKWQVTGDVSFGPYLKGSLGVGLDGKFSVEGWLGGGCTFEFGWPGNGTSGYKGAKVLLNAGVTITAWLWSWDWEGIKYEWPGNEPSKSSILSATEDGIVTFKLPSIELKEPRLLERNYVGNQGFGTFNNDAMNLTGKVSSLAEKANPRVAALATSTFPHSDPCIDANGLNLYMVWLVDDSTRTSLNRTVMKFATWDGTTWNGPSNIGTDDGTGDFHPFIKVFSNGDAVAVWENVSESLADGTSFDTFVTKLEIAAARYTASSGTWSEPVRLTTNSSIDWSPRVAGVSSDNVLVTWLNNESNDMTGNSTSPNKIMYSKWNGTSWSTAALAASVDRKIVKYSLVYNGTNGDLVYSADGTPVSIPSSAIVNDEEVVTSAVRDRELYRLRYLSSVWAAPSQFTSDTLPDDNPQLCLDPSNNVIMVWLKNNEIIWTSNFNTSLMETISTDTDFSNNIADATLISSAQGRFGLVWAESSGYSSDLYTMFYDQVEKVWGLPKRLTGDSETERNVSACFYGNESIVSVYNRNLMGEVQSSSVTALGQTVEVVIPQNIDTSLYMMRYVLNDDMIAQEIGLDPANPAEGTTVEIYVIVKNNSDRAVKNVPVAFYSGDPDNGGTLLGTETITDLMASGKTAVVTYSWVVPQGALPLSIYAVVDPVNPTTGEALFDTNYRSDNKVSVEGGKTDLAIGSMFWTETSQGVFAFTATVVNDGPVASTQTTCSFINMSAGANEAVFTTEVLPALAIGATAEVTYTWNTGGVAQPEYPVKLKLDPDNQVSEFKEDNNERVISAKGTIARAEVTPTAISYGNVGVNSNYAVKIVTLRNTGSATLNVGACVIGGTNEAEFKIVEDNCSNKALEPLDSATIKVSFNPTASGAKAAYLSIASDDPASPTKQVALDGSGSDVTLHSLAIDPERIPMSASDSFALSNIAVRAVFSDGTVSAPTDVVWTILSGGGTLANGTYTAGTVTGTAYLVCTYTVGAVSKAVQLRVDVVSPKPPVVTGLTFAESSPTGSVTSLATTVTVMNNCRFTWSGYDSDTVYQNWLYWCGTSIEVNAIPEELESSTCRLRLINTRPILDSRFATSGQTLTHDWNVSALYDNTEIFPSGQTTSNTLHIYCVALDDSPMPRDAGTQIVKSVDTLQIQKPDSSNTAPKFAFTTLASGDVTGASGKASIEFKVADETTDTVKVQFFYNKTKDSTRALQCSGLDASNAKITEVSVTPSATSLDSATASSFTWDLTGVTDGSYWLLARYTDSKHALAETWSVGKVTVPAEVTGNIAPTLEWLKPSLTSPVRISSGSVDLSFRVMDEDNDTLNISLYYNRSTVIDSNLVKLGQTYEVTGTSAWVGKTFSFDSTGLANGFYYVMAAVTQKDKGYGVFKYWSLVPVVIDRGTGISMLRVGTPQADSANAGKAAVNISFKTTEDAIGIVQYGLNGFTNLELRTSAASKTHVIAMPKLDAGKRYFFKVLAEATSGSRYEMDNQGKLFSFFIPTASVQNTLSRWLRGKVNHSTTCVVKVYLVKKDTAGALTALSKPLISGLDSAGEWAVNLGSAVNSATGATMEPVSADYVRVEIFAADNKFRYFSDVSISGIEYATTRFAGLAPETLWASGYGVELPNEYLDYEIKLQRGFNLVALPMEPETAVTAKTVLDSAGSDALAVFYFSSEEGQYKTYLRSGTIYYGTNFSIDITKGFFLKMNAAGSMKIRGKKIEKSSTMTALRGFNMMTISYGSDFPATTDTSISAKELLRTIGDDGLAIYSFVDGKYRTVFRLKAGDTDDCFFASPSDFTLEQGAGYFIKFRDNAAFNPEDLTAAEEDK